MSFQAFTEPEGPSRSLFDSRKLTSALDRQAALPPTSSSATASTRASDLFPTASTLSLLLPALSRADLNAGRRSPLRIRFVSYKVKSSSRLLTGRLIDGFVYRGEELGHNCYNTDLTIDSSWRFVSVSASVATMEVSSSVSSVTPSLTRL